MWTRFCETIFWGKGFAKPRLIFSGGDFGFRPRGGGVWGGIRADSFRSFLVGGINLKQN